jgi:hypothetical protein
MMNAATASAILLAVGFAAIGLMAVDPLVSRSFGLIRASTAVAGSV